MVNLIRPFISEMLTVLVMKIASLSVPKQNSLYWMANRLSLLMKLLVLTVYMMNQLNHLVLRIQMLILVIIVALQDHSDLLIKGFHHLLKGELSIVIMDSGLHCVLWITD